MTYHLLFFGVLGDGGGCGADEIEKFNQTNWMFDIMSAQWVKWVVG